MLKQIVLIVLILTLVSATSHAREIPEPQVRTAWVGFKTQFNRRYATPEAEQKALAVFRANLGTIEDRNDTNEAANGQRPFGVNQFADITPEEFRKTHTGLNPQKTDELLRYAPHIEDLAPEDGPVPVEGSLGLGVGALPKVVDWRGKYTSPVKDQGQCGSCWAFSVTETVESAYSIKHKTTSPILSVQQVVDCDGNDAGCNGGDPYQAYNYVIGAGLQTAASYPYVSGLTGYQYQCGYSPASVVARQVKTVLPISQCARSDFATCNGQIAKEPALTSMVATYGPVGVVVNASSWQYYKGGVVAGCPGGLLSLDHATQISGYSLDPSNGPSYWVVRNSWGSGWGEGGYIRLAMGVNACGVLDQVALAVVQ